MESEDIIQIESLLGTGFTVTGMSSALYAVFVLSYAGEGWVTAGLAFASVFLVFGLGMLLDAFGRFLDNPTVDHHDIVKTVSLLSLITVLAVIIIGLFL